MHRDGLVKQLVTVDLAALLLGNRRIQQRFIETLVGRPLLAQMLGGFAFPRESCADFLRRQAVFERLLCLGDYTRDPAAFLSRTNDRTGCRSCRPTRSSSDRR